MVISLEQKVKQREQTAPTGTHRDRCAICNWYTEIPDGDDLCATCRAEICQNMVEWKRMRKERRHVEAMA